LGGGEEGEATATTSIAVAREAGPAALANGNQGECAAVATEGDYTDLIVEQGLLQDDGSSALVMPFRYSVDQTLDSLNRWKGE